MIENAIKNLIVKLNKDSDSAFAAGECEDPIKRAMLKGKAKATRQAIKRVERTWELIEKWEEK